MLLKASANLARRRVTRNSHARTNFFSFAHRSSGILLHPTSLPGAHGSGDIGSAARKFADWLGAAGQRWWQMLPVGPPGEPPGNSPYSSHSSFAGSPYLIDLEQLVEDALLARTDLEPSGSDRFSDTAVNFPAMIRFRDKRLRQAFSKIGRAHV